MTNKLRDVRVDSATGVLITLVVYGHALSSIGGAAASAMLQWIFMFHVPAFVFLSGYATRFAHRWSLLDLAGRLLLPFLIFQLIHRLLISWLSGAAFNIALPAPAWTLWYLVALFAWRACAPLIARVPLAIALPASVAVSLLSGAIVWIGEDFALGRILGFLPFFVAGLLWKNAWLELLVKGRVWVLGLAALGAAAVWALANYDSVNRRAWWFSASYSDLGEAVAFGLWQRFLILGSMGVLTAAVLSLCLRPSRVLEEIGRASLAIYLLHPVLLYPWHVDGAPDLFRDAFLVVAAIVPAFVFSWLVSRPTVVAFLTPLLDYRWWVSRSRKWAGIRGRRRVRSC